MVGKASCVRLLQPLAVMLLGLGASYAPSMISPKEKRKPSHSRKLGPEPEIPHEYVQTFIEGK